MIRTRYLLLGLVLLAGGCQSSAAAAEPTATPRPTFTPTFTPVPTPTPDDRARETAVEETVNALRGTVTPTPEADPAGPEPTPSGPGSLAWARQAARDRGGLLFVANAGQRPGVLLMVRGGPGIDHPIAGEVESGDYLVGLAFRADGRPACTAGWVYIRDLQPEIGGSTVPEGGGWSCLNYLLDVEGRHASLPAAVPE